MALIKILNECEELKFNLRDLANEADEISIILKAKAGRQAVLEINAHKSIGIMVVGDKKIWVGAPA